LAAGGAAGEACCLSSLALAAAPGRWAGSGKARLAETPADAAAGSGPRESAAVTSSQQSQLRSEDSEPGRPRRSVRRGTGEEEEEVGVGGAAPQITSENLAAIWLPH